jgi:hypothetical protein
MNYLNKLRHKFFHKKRRLTDRDIESLIAYYRMNAIQHARNDIFLAKLKHDWR